MKTNNNNRENMNAANTGASYNKINDFGAKIGGARKDQYQAAREWTDRLADITADKLAAAGLSKLVRLPNLESMTAAGAISAEQARAALALWRTIDRKPAGTYKADRWADRTRETLAAIAAILTAEDLAAVLSDDLAALPDFQVLTAANWPAEAFSFGRYQVRRRPAYYSNAGKLSIVGGRYFVGTSSDDPADIAAQLRTMTAADAEKAAESRARGPKLGIYRTSDYTRYFIAVENKCEIVLKVCDTYREAAEAVKNDRAALLERYNALKNFPALRRSWNRPRVGREWHTEDVTPEQFAAALPFGGVEFGNWLNQQERAALLNSAFDGFHDLADLLGIPAEAVALGGRLNFSFATRGTANSAAHFESLYNTINLNKRNGAGCMAHEWLHACDHYAAVLSGRGNCTSWGEAFATEYRAETVTDADRAARELVAAIKSTDFFTRSRNYQRISGKQQGGEDYYIMPCELAARGFECVCLYLLQSAGQCSDFLVNLQSWQDFERDDAGHRRDCYPYPSEAEAAALLPYYIKFFRALFGRCEVSKKAAEGVAAATLQAAEEKAEADRLAAEKAEQEKKAAEAIRAARRAEQEQKAAEAKAKAEQTRAAIVDRLTAAHFDTIATGFDSVAVYFAANMQGEIFTGSVDIKTTEAEAVAAAQAAPLARVQYKRVHNAKRIICRRWKVAEVRANKYTAAEVLAELDGAEVRTIARTFSDFEKAETWNDAAHLWDDTQRAHKEKAARARQAAQERTAANEPTDSKAESKQGATISDPRAAGLQLVTIAEGVAVVGAAEDERTRGRQTWKARRDIKAHGCTWNRTAKQWEATTAEAVGAVRAWFGASEGTEAPAAPADIESKDNTATAAAELTPVYYSNREESQPAAIAASDEQGAPVIESPKIEEIATDEILTQWQTIKEKHPDRLLLFRCGDCYELYQDDAEKVAELLGLTIQTTASGYKVAAFPHYDISYQLPRLIRAGHSVAICDQLEAPKRKTVAPCYSTSEKSEPTAQQGETGTAGRVKWARNAEVIKTEEMGRVDVFEIVDEWPAGYYVWNIGREHFPFAGWLPLAKDGHNTKSFQRNIDRDHLKAIKVQSEAAALACMDYAHHYDRPTRSDFLRVLAQYPTDPTPDPSGEGVGVCHSYETGAPCYSTSEKLRNSESKERDAFNLPSHDERRPSAKSESTAKTEPTRNQEIAKIILQQLGGRQFAMMTGAKQFVAIDNGVRFRIGRNATRANQVKIVLCFDDTYNMEFWHIGREANPYTILMRYAKKGLSEEEYNKQVKAATERAKKAAEPAKLKAYEGIYFDQLQELFTQYTGLYMRLF